MLLQAEPTTPLHDLVTIQASNQTSGPCTTWPPLARAPLGHVPSPSTLFFIFENNFPNLFLQIIFYILVFFFK